MIGDTEIYLGDKLKKLRIENSVWAWGNSPSRYVKESFSNVEKYLVELADAHWKFPNNKAENSFVGDHSPDMDKNPALEQDLASWYQSPI